MSLLLDEHECEALNKALDYYLPQLRRERAGAEARDAQHELTLLENALEAIQGRLAEALRTQTEPPGAQVPLP
jgi:hypothetical protein